MVIVMKAHRLRGFGDGDVGDGDVGDDSDDVGGAQTQRVCTTE